MGLQEIPLREVQDDIKIGTGESPTAGPMSRGT